jgi:hypothetical protein
MRAFKINAVTILAFGFAATLPMIAGQTTGAYPCLLLNRKRSNVPKMKPDVWQRATARNASGSEWRAELRSS